MGKQGPSFLAPLRTPSLGSRWRVVIPPLFIATNISIINCVHYSHLYNVLSFFVNCTFVNCPLRGQRTVPSYFITSIEASMASSKLRFLNAPLVQAFFQSHLLLV